MSFQNKRLVKNRQSKMLAGVCAGIADYFEIDPTIVRLIWVVFSCFGAGIIAYIIAALVMPNE